MSPTAKSVAGAESHGSATIATVERAADILLHLANTRGPDFGITELSEQLGMSKAAIHRVLASLRSRGLVDLDERTRRYSLGVGALRLGPGLPRPHRRTPDGTPDPRAALGAHPRDGHPLGAPRWA